MTLIPGIEGKLAISLSVVAERGGEVTASIQSGRPVMACQVFKQQPWQRALDTLPLLFNVCSQAQSVAGVRAVEAALETPAGFLVEGARDLLVDLESLREHLWRILVDWPKLNGSANQMALLVPLNKTITELLRRVNPDGVLTTRPGLQDAPIIDASDDWGRFKDTLEMLLFANKQQAWLAGETIEESDALRLVAQQLKQDSQDLMSSEFVALPWLAQDFLAEQLQSLKADDFTAMPFIDNMLVETGPLARQRSEPLVESWLQQAGDGIATRMAVRLFETTQLLTRITERLSGGCLEHSTIMKDGLSQLEAVRGRLIHSVVLEGDRIEDYRILAPTEWNFSNNGIAVALLNRLKGHDTEKLSLQAWKMVHAVDPCVGFELNQRWAA